MRVGLHAASGEIREVFSRHGVRYLFIGKAGAILLGFSGVSHRRHHRQQGRHQSREGPRVAASPSLLPELLAEPAMSRRALLPLAPDVNFSPP